jgi:hypothetical protein
MTYNYLDALFENHEMFLAGIISFEEYMMYETILNYETERIVV